MSFLGVPVNMPNNQGSLYGWCKRMATAINSILNGKTNNIGVITLADGAGSTVVEEAFGRIGNDSVILFMPTTIDAATEFGAGLMYVSARSVTTNPQTFTITHTNNASTTRTFKYTIIG